MMAVNPIGRRVKVVYLLAIGVPQNNMKTFFSFLISRALWINVLIAAFVVFGLVIGSLQFLKSHTMHGDTIGVPDFTGIAMDGLGEISKQHQLRYLVLDSIHSDEHERGTVVNQNPSPHAQVKKNRKIYLTVNAMLPPMVTMRDMVGLSKRQAISMMQAMGLEVDSLSYRPDICLDCVLEQRHNGEPLEPGTKIQKGEKISLVLGGGQEGRVLVPELLGLDLENAKEAISFNSLVMGAIILCEGCETEEDTSRAVVYRQIPGYNAHNRTVIPMGSTVDLYLTIDSTAVSTQEPNLPTDDD